VVDNRFYGTSPAFTLAEVIEGLAVERPNSSFLNEEISNVATLDKSRPGDISYLGSKKNLSALHTAKATACFVTHELAPHVGAAHIIPLVTEFPRAHLSRVTSKLVIQKKLMALGDPANISETADIHPTAYIGSGAIIGENVSIAPYVVIGPDVVIGDGTSIESHVQIECALIGENCQIKSGAVIGGRGFGVDNDENGIVDIAHIGRVIIKDHVQIGAKSCVDRGQLGDTYLGNDVKLDNLVQIGHNVQIGDATLIAAQTGISGSCTIGKGVLMGGSVGLADHITIGDGVKIAARSGVMHDIPAGEYWGGIPALPIKTYFRMVSATRKLAMSKSTVKKAKS